MIVSVNLNERDIERIDLLKNERECSTRSEAIRVAIRESTEKFLPKIQPMGRKVEMAEK